MDPRRNPYAPGAGSRPPELAGRDELIEAVAIALDRIRDGRHAQSTILTGLRGVGKTVLLNEMRREAEARGIVTLAIEAPEGRSLPAMLAPSLRAALLRLDHGAALRSKAKVALGGLARFVRAFKVQLGEIEASIDFAPAGTADSGDLDHDLATVFDLVGQAAHERGTAVVLFIDELQYVGAGDLAALITALHRARQEERPVTLVAAGLPQLARLTGEAKSYAERLFRFETIGPLDPAAAEAALVRPAIAEDVEFTPAAIDALLAVTERYPYFLQEWGARAWEVADASPIDADDVAAATPAAIAALDRSFFRVRFDRMSPAEKRYLRGMAELGPGPTPSSAIAAALGRGASSFGPVRATLIAKGMIYLPGYGETAFTVPLFDDFLRRALPFAAA
jgi:anti-anti-sigma regulatory factor